MTVPHVQLFILSRDRVDFCREAVGSALAQTYPNYEVIVSDNSVGDEVQAMLAKEFPSVKVRRRLPNLPALEHFNRVIAEANAPLTMLFHDDDVLESDFLTRMVSYLDGRPDVTAVGSNARIIRGQQLTATPFMGDFSGLRELRQPVDLLEPYLSLSLTSPAPFPGYLYRTAAIRGLGLDGGLGGKHADVSFLSAVLQRGPMLWTDACNFRYRFHGHNDSSSESIADRLSWLRFVYSRNGISPRSQAVRDYKFMYWLRWLKQTAPNPGLLGTLDASTRRRFIARRFVVRYGLQLLFTRSDFWRRAWRALRR
jgi:cellulose synthase/poly-beta-1,6-N-acetylglucosamine synthase-like glycosyltransferase